MAKEEVRDGYFGDLPEDIRIKVMNIHKLIVDACNAEFKRSKYEPIQNQQWAKSMLEKFLTMPTDNSNIGSVRVYKKGKRYRCMIQITDHVINPRNTEDEDLFHGMIRNAFVAIRSKVRRQFDCTITCESEHGEPFEGYDVWTKSNVAHQIWDSFGDMKTKKVNAMTESGIGDTKDIIYCGLHDLPHGLQSTLLEYAADEIDDGLGDTVLSCRNGIYEGYITLSSDGSSYEKIVEQFEHDNPCKYLVVNENGAELELDSDYAKFLMEWIDNNLSDSISYTESVDQESKDAKKTLRALSQKVIDDATSDGYKFTQYTADTYANLITKNFLHQWAPGYNKLSIKLDSYQSLPTFEFKIPKMTQDFVYRLIEGRETLNGFLHRNPEITIKMSPRIFHTMKNPDDGYNFFRAALRYYSEGVMKYGEKVTTEAMHLNREMKHLVSTTKLSGIVTAPLQMIFTFDNVNMSDKKTFTISTEDIKTVNQFIKNISSRYAAPEKEKKAIIDDLNKIIESFRESCDDIQFADLSREVTKLYEGGYNDEMSKAKDAFYTEQLDTDWERKQSNPEIKLLQEKFGVKKLKKIPRDLVAYITIEAESIRDANDKMMIASYCLAKLDIVEWYIELIDVGSKKYIVPHTKPYLETVRTQLLACYKKIMDTKIKNPNDRPIIDINYPNGYAG